MSEHYYQVAVDAPLKEPLTYAPPADSPRLSPGTPVMVPLGRRSAKAVVLEEVQSAPTEFKVKSVTGVDESRPVIPAAYIAWLRWLSDYYLHPIGQVMGLVFPPLKPAKKKRKSKKSPVVPQLAQSTAMNLTQEQQAAVSGIQAHSKFSVHLLHGVTGSGKTEVYLQLLEEVLKKGQQGLVLVPEISLTPQLVNRFSSRFPDKIALIHSHLTGRQKTDNWWGAFNQEKSILIGARSALFCPMENLGLIVIDEEHENSFKQDEKLKYHGRDAAVVLAKKLNIPIVLGSATPSLETWQNVQNKKYFYHPMTQRVSNRPLPNIEVVDMREERSSRKLKEKDQELPYWLSRNLYEKLIISYEKKEQSALFLNRRGMAQTVLCQDCGHVYECPNCAITLTLHASHHLVCHYCDYSESLKEHCTECNSPDVKPLGVGTERVENDLATLFPEARIARADRDEIQNREAMVDLVQRMEDREIDILVGTQMIAKGLDFPGLNLVGLVMADVGFNMPDFRSAERNFQLVTQVSGRSGRHQDHPGEVVIQTYNPEHICLKYARNNDLKGFVETELEQRAMLHYPPFGRLASLRIQGLNLQKVKATATTLAQRAQHLIEQNDNYQGIQILGPSPSPLARLRGKYRFLLLLKSKRPHILSRYCKQLLSDVRWTQAGTKVQIDIDPINMM